MKNQSGFTIAELILVVVLAAILAAMAAPNMGEFVKNNARTTNVNSLVTALNFARSQAVTRNERITVCRPDSLNNPTQCAAAGNGEFEGGWVVFSDNWHPIAAGGAIGQIDTGHADPATWPDEVLLRVFEPEMAGTSTLRARRGGIAGTAIAGITYRRDGRPEDLAAPGTTLSAGTLFNYCDDRGAPEARAIALTVAGHVSLSRDTNSDGTDEIYATPLVCP